MIGNPLLLGPEGYQISRSVRLRSSASAYFNRTPGSVGNRQTLTLSNWVKRGALGSQQDIFIAGSNTSGQLSAQCSFDSSNQISLYGTISGSAADYSLVTTQVFRDPSAWYHIVLMFDTTNATAANRVRLYVNGVQVTSFSSATYPSQNYSTAYNNTVSHTIGRFTSVSANPFDGYMTEINFIDGQALTPSSFGETDAITGVWKPKKYAGTYGTNGFFLNFSDNSSNTATTIGKDYSGNGNNWTPNNISVTSGSTYDSMLDVPTLWADGGNGRGNYCTLNPLDKNAGTTPSNANLTWTASTPWRSARATFGMTTGKWYWEVTASGANNMHGIGTATAAVSDNNYPGKDANGWGYFDSNGNKFTNGSGSSYGASYTTNDVIGVAFDADNGTLTFYKNGTSQGTAFTGLTSGPYFPMVGNEGSTSHSNFGQRPFAYTPPTGFKALNTQNLPEPVIKKGNQYFDAKAYTGNGGTQTISGMQFAPDLVWIKNRGSVTDHGLFDTVRGATKRISSNLANAESTEVNSLTAFTSDGFTVGATQDFNQNGVGLVGWQWKEGATPGFDIVTYTGTGANRTIAHNLGVAPAMMIVKRRDSGPSSWTVWHSSFSSIEYIYLNLTNAKSSSSGSTVWNSTLPTSSVFSLGTYSDVNASGGTHVAYLFAEVAGFSRFGSYTGNGSSDGTFVFCGFRPRWIMIKRTDSSPFSWCVVDTSRSPANTSVNGGMQNLLFPNNSNAEDTGADMCDGVSNGFKFRQGASSFNASGGTYIFAAFAENPFKYALAR
jgi:hypothetical protein